MKNEILYAKMADLVVQRGLHVQKGQAVVIRANIRDVDFVRLVTKRAYEAGARSVEIDWHDEEMTKMHYTYQTKEELMDIPDWIHDQQAYRHEKKACYLTVLSDRPGTLKDIDGEKIRAASFARNEKLKDLDAYTTNNISQWCIIGLPSREWSEYIFPDLSSEEAFEKLSEGIFSTSRIDADSDPCLNWQEHDEALRRNAEKMTSCQFDALHFQNAKGTDLTVHLVKNHIWNGGNSFTQDGVLFDPNIPTEEIFCMPDRNRVDGVVYSTKPLPYNGKVIEDFWLRFENGRVEEFHAEKEEETLKELLDLDEGSRHLGEVALVPYDSPVSNSNILFFNILYDENASCHLALGKCYPENLAGGMEMDEEELLKHGANSSFQHVDFMFGSADLSVDGVKENGVIVPVFRNGNFVI